jgi:hypothetical protein
MHAFTHAHVYCAAAPSTHLCLVVLHQLGRLVAVLRDVPVLLLQQLLHLLVDLGGLQVLVQRLQLAVLSLRQSGGEQHRQPMEAIVRQE